MIYTTYAHVARADRQARFPTRFAALDALLSTVTSAGVVIEREAIPMDSGLDAISVFSPGGDDQFLIMRVNEHTFTISRKPRGTVV